MLKIKVGGVYKISIGDKFYIGYSISIFDRWSNHMKDLYLGKHHSVDMQKAFKDGFIEDFKFEVLEHVSKSDFKKQSGLKGKIFEAQYRKMLIVKEKEWMGKFNKSNALNTDNKHFG